MFLQLRQVIAQCRIMPTNQWAEKRELQRHCAFCTVVFTIKISSVILLIKLNEIQKETGTATFATLRHSNFENAFVSNTIVDFSQFYRNRFLCNSKPQTTLISYSRFRTNFHLRLLGENIFTSIQLHEKKIDFFAAIAQQMLSNVIGTNGNAIVALSLNRRFMNSDRRDFDFVPGNTHSGSHVSHSVLVSLASRSTA